jgi:integral membrane protein (TIGR00529 family)
VALLNPLLFFVVSIGFFLVLLYRKIGVGIALTVSAFLMSILSFGVWETGTVLLETCVDVTTLSLVFASFFIMLMSTLYKETGLVNSLTKSLSGFIKNSKIIVGVLPAVIGLMPVAGGALMSAPIVDAEADKLGLDNTKKTFVNIWFRHAIIPVYPVTQFIVLTAALTQIRLDALVVRQIFVVIVMITIGYLIGLRKTQNSKPVNAEPQTDTKANFKLLLTSFSPIIVTVVLTALLNVDIAVSTLAGVVTILVVTKSRKSIPKVLKNRAVWEVTLAAFGAMLLKNVTVSSGASEILGSALASMNMNGVVILTVVPAVLALITGSTSGAIALSIPILAETVVFTPQTASLLYMAAYLGYIVSPTHLCLVFTVEYFKTSMTKSMKYLLPAIAVSLVASLVTYFII